MRVWLTKQADDTTLLYLSPNTPPIVVADENINPRDIWIMHDEAGNTIRQASPLNEGGLVLAYLRFYVP